MNLISDFMYDEAIEQAKQIDRIYEANKNNDDWKPEERLFGIPISVKDVYEIYGHDTTMGAAVNCFKPKRADGLIIKILKGHGLIPFVMTTTPQQLQTNETNSWIFGRAENPWNNRRSTGGSSGGEAGVISLGCSPIGLGSDGAGSIRGPALGTGIYGFKPTKERWPLEGHVKVGGYLNSV